MTPDADRDRWHRLLGSAIHKPVKADLPVWPGFVLLAVVVAFIWLASYAQP